MMYLALVSMLALAGSGVESTLARLRLLGRVGC